MWFRRDLRLIDNEAVHAASTNGATCAYVFVIDPWFFEQPEIGWLRVKFLFESLAALHEQLARQGNELIILKGESVSALTKFLGTLKQKGYVPKLYFNHDMQVEYGKKRDDAVKKYCDEHVIDVCLSHNFFLLHDENHMNEWWKKYYDYQYASQLAAPDIKRLDDTVRTIAYQTGHLNPTTLAESLGIARTEPRQSLFVGGEHAAHEAVYSFLKDRVDGYRWKISRPYLAQRGATSLLGPHLAFGTISNRTVFQAAIGYKDKIESKQPKKAFDIATYLDRLRWRDSFTQRLWFHPELMWQNRFPEFDEIYQDDTLTGQKLEYFERWKQGTTGFPLLDAAMTQLREDGFINFRMRAMSATFLAINSQVSWHHGARHFMNCLVDGDIAINHWQWQMQSGITNPLSPTFRMYDPTKNFRDRDGDANYVHFWLPETRGKNIDTILREAEPMLDFKQTRMVNGKVVSDLRKIVRERIIAEKGLELSNAETMNKTVKNYTRYSADRYKRYIK